MKTHICNNDTVVDLKAIAAISAVEVDYGYVFPYMYKIKTHLGGTIYIAYDTRVEEAKACRNKLIETWLKSSV